MTLPGTTAAVAAADAARDAYVRDLTTGWMRQPAPFEPQPQREPTPPAPRDAGDEGEAAYASYLVWLRDGWRSR